MRPIATDTNDFPKLREKGCIYVDKTEFVHRMVSEVGTNLFFIARPRRFGKSLTLSVLKALFSGRRELFEGLYIDKTNWKWEKYPVIHFEFNDVDASSVEAFEKSFAEHVQERLEDAGYAYDQSKTVAFNFGNAILKAAGDTKRPLYYLSLAGVINLVLNLIASVLGVVLVFVRFIATGANPLSNLFLYMLFWTLPVLLVSFFVSVKR